MLYEYHEFNKNVLSSEHQDYREIHYVEMALAEAWRWKLDEEYFKMFISHKMCIWWAYCNDESFNATNYTYRHRMSVLHSMRDDRHRHLFKYHYLNDDSKFAWTLDNIRTYRHQMEVDTKLDEPNQTSDQVVEDWLHAENETLEMVDAEGEDNDLPFTAPDENMTPEQRSIQWAIQHGGANNL